MAMIGMLASIALPRFGRARDRAAFVACGQNLKNVAIALQSYSVDNQLSNQSTYPASLTGLVPEYLSTFPTCPTRGIDSYSASYTYSQSPPVFTIFCSGSAHEPIADATDVPWYRPGEGLGPR
jgi:type II secretory pathway pseudopilin PulG